MRAAICPLVTAMLVAVLWGCGGGGGSGDAASAADPCQGVGAEMLPTLGLSGPGDPSRLFPLAAGNLWQYQVDAQDGGMVLGQYTNTVSVVASQANAGGQPAFDVDESNVDGSGYSVLTTMIADANGIAAIGGHDPLDLAMLPRWVVRYPIQPGSEFVQTNRRGVTLQGDLDGDGQGELLNICSIVRILSPEDVTVPAGSYPAAARMQVETRLAIRGSATGQTITGTEVDTLWLAPGVGPVRRLSTGNADGVSFSYDERLRAYFVDGVAINLEVATSPVASGVLTPGESRSWLFANVPEGRTTVALTGLSGRARVEAGPCSTAGGGAAGGSLAQCTFHAVPGPLLVWAQGIDATPFFLSLTANPVVAQPAAETKAVPPSEATPGQVVTRGTSWYTTNVAAGSYGVYVLGASGDVNLHVYAGGYPMESDCTLRAFTGTQSCILQTTAGDLSYSVDSGPLNRDGASYLLLVHPMP